LPAAAEITDETLTPILWELCTISLSGLLRIAHGPLERSRSSTPNFGQHGLRDLRFARRSPRGGWFHDFIAVGRGDMQLWLRYFATDEERAKHAAASPKDTIPPKEKPPAQSRLASAKGFLNRTQVSRYSFQYDQMSCFVGFLLAALGAQAADDYVLGPDSQFKRKCRTDASSGFNLRIPRCSRGRSATAEFIFRRQYDPARPRR